MNRRFFNQQNLTRRLRLLPVLFAMLLMPIGAWAEDYDIIVGGVPVTSENAANIFGQDYATASYDNASYTLTLKGVYYGDQTSSFVSIGSSLASLTVHLVGYNQVGYDAEKLFSSTNACTVNITTDATVPGKLQYYGESSGMTDNNVTLNFGTSGLALDGTNIEATSSTSNICYFGAGQFYDDDPNSDYPYCAYTNSIIWYFSNAAITNGNNNYPPIVNSSAGNVSRMKTSGSAIIKSLTFQYVPVSGGTINVALTSLDGGTTYATGTLANGLVTLIPNTQVTYDDVCLTFTSESAFSFVPMAIKTIEPESYGITVAGVQVTSDNASNITGDNITGTVSYDAENKILTLNGAHISGNIQRTSAEDLTVNLVGSNEITIASANDCVFVGNAATASPKLTLTTDKSEPGTLKVNGLASKTSIASGWSSSSSTFVYASDDYPENGDWWVQTHDEYMDITLNRKYDLLWGGRPYCDANLDPVAGAKFVPEESTLEYGYRESYSFTSSLPALKVKVTAEDAQMGTITFQSKGEVTSGTLTFEAKDADGKYSLSLSSNDGGPAISGFSSVNFTSPMHLTDPATVADLATASYVSIANYDSYNLQVGDINVTSLNADNILNDANATVKYNYETNTLTLNGATINGGIFCGRDVAFTVHLLGNNVIDGQYDETNSSGDKAFFAETCPKLIFTTDENAPGQLVMKNTLRDGGDPQYYGEGFADVEYASGLSAADSDTDKKRLIVTAPVITPAEGVYWPTQQYTITGLSGATLKYYYRDTVTDEFVETTASSFTMENIGRHLVQAAQTLTVDGTSFEMIGGDKVYIVRNALTFDLPEGTYGGTQNVKIENLPEGYDNTYDYTQVWYYLGDDEDNPVQYTSADQTIAVSESTKVTAYIIDGDSGKQFKSEKTEVEYTIKANPNLRFTYIQTNVKMGETFSQEVLSDMPTTPTVTWSSSNEAVATVDPNTGVVTPVAAYNSDIEITATFAGDDTYAPATASYAVRVDKGEQYLRIKYKDKDIPLAKVKVEKGNPIDIKTEYDFSCPEELVGTLVWHSNDENVVTVTNGVITTVGCGSTWIKVSSAGNSNYESHYCDFNIEVAPPKPTINLAEGTYMSTHDPITITKADIANTAITYTWDDVTDYNVSPTWKDYTDEGVALQKTGTLYARVGYTTNDGGVIYSDTASVAYTVIPDIAECTVSVNDNVTYTGAAQTPTITVTPAGGGETLVLGTDYTVSYKKGETAVESMIDAGDYTIVITAKEGSAYGGTKEVGFTITQAKLSAVTIAAIDDQTFTGSQITPAVTVTFNEKTVSTEEYNVVYGENKNVGEGAGTVTLTSKNKNFVTSTDADATTKQTATFNIVAATAAITATDQTVTFNGEERPFTNYTIANGEAVVTYYSSEEARAAQSGGTTSAPTNADTYYVQVTQVNNNYTSDPADATFTISPMTLTSEMVTLSATSFVYSGAAQTPDVTVADGDNILTINTNYDYVIKQGETVVASPMNVGSYSVVVTGKGNYSGTATQTFTIAAKDLASATVTVDATQTYTYTGAAIEPNVSSVSIKLTEGADVATNLTAGTDYTVTGYANNTDAALATAETNAPTVTITGKGNFTGTATGTFTIAQAKLSAVTIAAIGNQTFTGSQITPGVTVTFNEKTVSTDEYNVVYGDNINAGENAGTVTLTSKNKNFVTSTDEDATTKKTATFNIVAATAAITATDQTVTFNGEEQPFTNYTIANGEAVVTYYSSEEARTAKTGGTTNAPTNAAIYYVQVTQGDDNYTSAPANATFTISPKALTEGMVEQDGVSFTYSGYTPEYSVSVKDGEEYLAGDDYDCVIKQGGTEIIPVNAGSYDVVVTGKRNYTGTITKTLTITKAQLTVTPDDKTYNVGDDITLTVSYEGFVNGETETVLTTQPSASYGTADVTKPGSYEITASGGVAQNYDFIYKTGTLTINRQLTVSFSASNTWATYCGTENLSTPEGLKAYQVTAVEGATVTISEIGYIPANTAVLLQNVSNNNVWTNIAANAYTDATSTFENNKLIGTASAVDVSTITGGTVYILVNNMFRRSTSGSIPANRGYLVVAPSSSNAPQLSISIGDENTTGVQTLNVERGTLNDDSWYTIDGRKLQQAPVQKGLYIKNGKKVFINKK